MSRQGVKWQLAIAAAAAVLFAAVAVLVVRQVPLVLSLDSGVHEWVASRRFPALTGFMGIYTHLAEWFVYLPLALLLLALPRTRRPVGLPVAATMAVSALLNLLLKALFAIPRPPDQLVHAAGMSFPSGHTMTGTAFTVAIILLIWNSGMNPARKTIFTLLAAVYVIGIWFSRVYLGVHNPSDIIGGFLAGLAVAMAVSALFNSSLLLAERGNSSTHS
ncbi:MAG: phosphatase PAP2 family protein [Oscillospiraceae bacterium]|nr:phosphatase PAP2 family protein [Oscillospiraceae bacterium]